MKCLIVGRAGRRLRNADHDHRDVVGPALEIGQIDQRPRRFGGRHRAEHGGDLFVFHLARQAVAAEDERVACFERQRPFEIDFHFGMRTERAGDDVFGNEIGDVAGRQLAGGHHLPDQAVIERELFEAAAPVAIDAAVAHVGHDRPLGQQDQHAGRRSHAVEFGIGLASAVDVGIRFDDRLAERFGGSEIEQFVIGVRYAAGGQFAGQFACRVGSHAVGHQKEMAAFAPIALVAGQHHRVGVLIVRTAQTDVTQRGMLDKGEPTGIGFGHGFLRSITPCQSRASQAAPVRSTQAMHHAAGEEPADRSQRLPAAPFRPFRSEAGPRWEPLVNLSVAGARLLMLFCQRSVLPPF